MSTPVSLDSNRTCDECGATGAYVFDGQALCLNCYTGRGSCCAEREMADVPLDATSCTRERSASPGGGASGPLVQDV